MANSIYTIGHGDRSIEELIQCLREFKLEVFVDVRSHPHSTRFPQFEQDSLRASIEAQGMVYHWAGRQLGGQRRAHKNSQHTGLKNAALQAYADHMEKEVFRLSAQQLIRLTQQKSCVLFCAERDPYQCHRSLLADYLCLQGYQLIHILGPGDYQPHRLTTCLCVEAGRLRYEDAQAARH